MEYITAKEASENGALQKEWFEFIAVRDASQMLILNSTHGTYLQMPKSRRESPKK